MCGMCGIGTCVEMIKCARHPFSIGMHCIVLMERYYVHAGNFPGTPSCGYSPSTYAIIALVLPTPESPIYNESHQMGTGQCISKAILGMSLRIISTLLPSLKKSVPVVVFPMSGMGRAGFSVRCTLTIANLNSWTPWNEEFMVVSQIDLSVERRPSQRTLTSGVFPLFCEKGSRVEMRKIKQPRLNRQKR